MFAEERKNKIEKEINREGKVKVAELAKKYSVSKATIRRDLTELEALGIVKRTHGGAVAPLHTKAEPTYFEKEDQFAEEKEILGKFAALFIKKGDTVALDSGTTTLQIAKYIDVKDITVITNSIMIARLLTKKEGIEVILTGGDLRPETLALVGPLAEKSLENFNIDKVFLGANGVSEKSGFTTPNVIEASIKKKFIEQSKKVIFVCDASKIGRTSFVKIADLASVDVLIIEKIKESIKKTYENKGLNVFLPS